MRIHLLFAAFASVVVLGACSSSTDTGGSPIERTFAVYAVNGDSPDAKTYYDVSGNRISIPRGTLTLHKDGSVQEVLQYAIYFNNGVLNFAATDTTAGRYEWNNGQYDVTMPNTSGTMLYSGAVYPATDFVSLNRSWVKNNVTVKLTITYSKN